MQQMPMIWQARSTKIQSAWLSAKIATVFALLVDKVSMVAIIFLTACFRVIGTPLDSMKVDSGEFDNNERMSDIRGNYDSGSLIVCVQLRRSD